MDYVLKLYINHSIKLLENQIFNRLTFYINQMILEIYNYNKISLQSK